MAVALQTPEEPADHSSQPPSALHSWRRVLGGVALALPGALTAYAAFRAGGFYAGTTGAMAAGLAVAVALRALMARDPLAGATGELALAAGAVGLFALWTLVSSTWSHAPGRAVIEFDRALLYALTVVLLGSLAMTASRLRWALRWLALAVLAVCVAGLASRTRPDILAASGHQPRLGYPIGYSNALGLLGALGLVASLHLTASGRERQLVRVAAAGAMPVLAATVYLTFSRGAIAAGALGLVAYLVLARPRLLLTGVAAGVPAAVVAVHAAYGATALSAPTPAAAAVPEGRHVAAVVLVSALGAMAARAVLLAGDAAILRRRWLHPSRPVAAGLVAAIAAAGVLVVASSGAPGYVQRQYRPFVERPAVANTGDQRDRLVDPSGNGRADFWRLALQAWRTEPLHGHGAGTYQLLWQRSSPYGFQLYDGHSLYLESLAELGVVGLALVGGALLTLLLGLARRIRGPDRSVFAAVLAAALTWAAHAGIDWDWEVPAVTLGVLALAAAALAVPVDGRATPAAHRPPRWPARVVAAAACLALAVLPLRTALSQRHLNGSVHAFARDDCPRAAGAALRSIDALGVRPEPYELLAYCEVRLGAPALAVRTMANAVRLDPGNWQYHYGLALVRGAAGLDPRPSARRALRLNPREGLARAAVDAFATADPRLWRARALAAQLPRT